jgi:hypothetical protein
MWLALAVHAPITIVVEHGNGNLHGGVRSDNKRENAPREMRPRCQQREYRDGDDVQSDRAGMAEQE